MFQPRAPLEEAREVSDDAALVEHQSGRASVTDDPNSEAGSTSKTSGTDPDIKDDIGKAVSQGELFNIFYSYHFESTSPGWGS